MRAFAAVLVVFVLLVSAWLPAATTSRLTGAVVDEAIARCSDGTAGFHVSFDLDGMDPADAPGVGTPVKGGIDWREANLLMELVADSQRMLSLEVTELNPILDLRNHSAEVGTELILSALGQRIV